MKIVKKKLLLILLLILLFKMHEILAQENNGERLNNTKSGTTQLIETRDKNKFIGRVIDEDAFSITLLAENNTKVVIPRKEIVIMETLNADNYKNGVYWFPNPNATRYFFSTSAFTLESGDGYYQNTYVTLNAFNVGITDHFSILVLGTWNGNS